VNLAQIRSADPEIFDAQTKKNAKKSQTALKAEPRTLLACGYYQAAVKAHRQGNGNSQISTPPK